MDDFWILNIFDIVREMSDLQFQKDAWFGKSSKVSSYTELITSLYDDNQFEEFINHDYWNNCREDLRPIKQILNELNSLINNYQSSDSDDMIIIDPLWHSIVDKAKEVIHFWIISIKT